MPPRPKGLLATTNNTSLHIVIDRFTSPTIILPLPNLIEDYEAPTIISQRQTAITAYDSSSTIQVTQSREAHLAVAKQYWSIAQDPKQEDLRRVGAYHQAITSAKTFAAFVTLKDPYKDNDISHAELLHEMYRTGLPNLKDCTLNAPLDGYNSRLWNGAQGEVKRINKELTESHKMREKSIHLWQYDNKYVVNSASYCGTPTPSIVAARFIIVANLVHDLKNSYLKTSIGDWKGYLDQAIKEKQILLRSGEVGNPI